MRGIRRRSRGATALRCAAAVLAVVAIAALVTRPTPVAAADTTLYAMSTDGAWRSAAGTTWLAQSFPASSTNGALGSVRVQIRNTNESNSSSVPSTFSVSVWSSSSGVPATKLADLVAAEAVGAWGDGSFTYTPTSEVLIGTAAATFFVVVSGSAGGTIGWKCAPTAPTADEPAGSYPNLTSADAGSSWSAISSGACAGNYFNMTVVATAATAPTTTTSTTTTSTTTTSTPSPTSGPVVPTPTTAAIAPATTTVAPPPATTSTTSPTTTTTDPGAGGPTTTSAPVVTTPPPSDPPAGDGNYFDRDAVSALEIVAEIGTSVDGALIRVVAFGLVPGSDVVARVHSDPVEVVRGLADIDGSFAATAPVPVEVGPGTHTVVLDTFTADGPQRAAGTLTLDESLVVTGFTPAAVVSPSVEPGDTVLERAAAAGIAVYDASANPATTTALAVAAASVLALAAVSPAAAGGSAAGSSSGGDGPSAGRRRDARGKLAGFVTKKLKSTGTSAEGWGDRHHTWALPLTAASDSWSRQVPVRAGAVSAVLPRVWVDGAWLRAALGSFGYFPWLVGLVIGVVSGANGPSVVAPAAATATLIAALGILDAGTGLCAWVGSVLGALVVGNVTDPHDLRTLLGMGVLYAGLAPLAHVIRPLRRVVATRGDVVERVFDYVIVPVFLAFAGGSMLKALNGLSALDLVSAADVSRAVWVFGLAIVARLALEDLARSLYPIRLAEVQPAKLTSPLRRVSWAGVAGRSVITLFVAVPFFGLTWRTLLTVVLLAVPTAMKLYEDDLPNRPIVHRWLPRGLFRFLCLLVLGAWLSTFVGSAPESLRRTAPWLLVPSVVVGVAELFGRQGGDWDDVRVKWGLGAVVWAVAAGIVTGTIVLF